MKPEPNSSPFFLRVVQRRVRYSSLYRISSGTREQHFSKDESVQEQFDWDGLNQKSKTKWNLSGRRAQVR